MIYNKNMLFLAIIGLLPINNAFATPKLSGNYIVSMTRNCQATVTYKNNVINDIKPGEISSSLRQLKFTPDNTGFAGAITQSGYSEWGNNIRSNAYISNNTLHEEVSSNKAGSTYANTATTFTVFGSKSRQYHIYYSDIDGNNIAHYAAIIGLRDDSNLYNNVAPNKCAEQGSFKRQ